MSREERESVLARRKVVMHMAMYKIVRIYEVPGANRIQASERMREALSLGVERDFHVNDLIRLVDEAHGLSKKISLGPPTGWLTLLQEQLLGRSKPRR